MAGWWWTSGGSSLETALDVAAAEGYELIDSFTVDDNVYLILRRPEVEA